MAAADFVKGAMTGYQFVDGQYRQNEYDNQRKAAIQTEDERYQQGQERQTRLDAEAAEDRTFTRNRMVGQDAMAAQTQALNLEDRAFERRRMEGQDAMAAQQAAIQLQDRDQANTDRTKRELREQAVFSAQRAMAGGSPFPRELHDQLNEAGMSYLSFYDGIERPDIHQAALSLAPVLQAVGSGNIAAINSPQSIEAINQLYADEINEGIGEFNRAKGATVVSKRIAQLAPGPQPGKFGVILEVTLDNGETYLAPRTRAASTDENDPVRLIDAGVALDDLMGRYQLARLREEGSESIRSQYRSIYGALPGEQQAQQPVLKQATNDLTGQTDFFAWDGQNLNRVEPREPANAPSEAVAELLQDPSPQAIAEFDEVFGPGAANRYLNQR